MKEQNVTPVIVKTESGQRLSPWRVFVAILLLGGIGYAAYINRHKVEEIKFTPFTQFTSFTQPADTYKPWFAAYVDVTSTPTYAFEQLNSKPTSDVVLSFIVSSKAEDCTPSWGTYFTLDEATTTIDLDRRIARLQQQGGKIAISFGGALNDELSVKCKDPEMLVNAYKSVIERYNIDTIDLDLENHGLTDTEAGLRRAIAIAQLQKDRRANDKGLAVWLTLPVAPQGLTKDGTDAVAQMLSNGVDLSGINVMTMDYGGAKTDGQSMLDASQQALSETHRQLGILYTQAGISLDDKSLWRKIGATPMIGQNDIVDEVFTLENAEGLNQFGKAQGIGRMSMWSANRDILCGENYVDIKVVSDSCSGVQTPKYSFAQALSKDFDGDLGQNANILTIEDPETNTQVVDDPAKSPYQIWQKTGGYPKGTKVVWHGNVYEAKWWTKNDLPDNPVLQYWETPWQLMGPVLPGEKPIPQLTLPVGTYKEWSGTVVYTGGERILFEGVPYQAKWWNEAQSPAASAANPDSTPWLPLSQAQVMDVIKAKEATTSAKKKVKETPSTEQPEQQ